MPVLYNHQGVPSPYAPLSGFLSSHYFLSSSSTWLCGTLVFLALLGIGIRKARSRAISTMSSPPPQQNAKSQPQSPSRSPSLTHVQSSRDLQSSYSEKEQLSSSSISTLSYSPVAIPENTFPLWTAELPAPTLSPVEASDFWRNDRELPRRDLSRGAREMSRTTSLPLPAPRRRSYNKSLTLDGSMGVEVSEEIIMAAEGWRRHTRVFGGGVCQACLESEQKQGETPGQIVRS